MLDSFRELTNILFVRFSKYILVNYSRADCLQNIFIEFNGETLNNPPPPLKYSTFDQSFVGGWGRHHVNWCPRYRELNIMNRVLNKDFFPESYQIPRLILFWCFPSCILYAELSDERSKSQYKTHFSNVLLQTSISCFPQGESDEEW
jgi:hypothetical protein